MKNSKPKIAVIILNYNGKDNTIACLKSLSQSSVNNFIIEIIVVDNNSHDNSCMVIRNAISKLRKEYIQKESMNIILIANNDNLGFCEGNNIGIKKALENKADYIFILNNDTIVANLAIGALLQTARRNKNTGIIGPKIYFAPGFEYHQNRYQDDQVGKVIWYAGGDIDWNNLIFSHRGVDDIDRGQYDRAETTDFISGCAMFIKKEVFDNVKLFDKRYFLYLEDVDLCERVRQAGFELLYEPKAIVWHKNASATGKPGSIIHVYYQTRNRLIFGYSYCSWRTKLSIFRESIKMLFGNDPIQRKAVWDFYTGNFERADNLI